MTLHDFQVLAAASIPGLLLLLPWRPRFGWPLLARFVGSALISWPIVSSLQLAKIDRDVASSTDPMYDGVGDRAAVALFGWAFPAVICCLILGTRLLYSWLRGESGPSRDTIDMKAFDVLLPPNSNQ